MFADVHQYQKIINNPRTAKYSCLCLATFMVCHIGYLSTKSLFPPALKSPQRIITKKNIVSPLFLNRPLFGQYSPQTLPQNEIKSSTLPIHIEGIIFSTVPNESSVILKIKKSDSKNYYVGDTVLGATIKKITPDSIILLRHGAFERLTLPKNELLFDALDPEPRT